MRTVLTMCVLTGALLGPRHAGGPRGSSSGSARPRPTPACSKSRPIRPAHVLIDDVDTKTVTPQGHLELKAGHHKLTLVTLDGSRKRTLGFNVEVGQTTKLSIHLTP